MDTQNQIQNDNIGFGSEHGLRIESALVLNYLEQDILIILKGFQNSFCQ